MKQLPDPVALGLLHLPPPPRNELVNPGSDPSRRNPSWGSIDEQGEGPSTRGATRAGQHRQLCARLAVTHSQWGIVCAKFFPVCSRPLIEWGGNILVDIFLYHLVPSFSLVKLYIISPFYARCNAHFPQLEPQAASAHRVFTCARLRR